MPHPLGVAGRAAEAAIADVCARGLPALELFGQVAERVRRVVPYTAGCWKPLDPQTLLFTGFAIEDPEPGRLAAVRWRFVDNELLDPDVAKFRELARRPRPVATLEEATHGEPGRSLRYRHLHRNLGFGAELRAVFRTGRTCWGSVALVRDAGEPDFSRAETGFLTTIGGHIADGLRAALLRDAVAGSAPDPTPGMVVLTADGTVESLTPQAECWLDDLPADRGTGLGLPAVVHAVARRSSGSATVRGHSGRWLFIHAAPLHERGGTGGGRIGVVLGPARPDQLTSLRLDLHGLTDRESEIAQLLARGDTIDDIAGVLWISRHTVKDHIKAIYAKLGVRSRSELAATLFYRHYLPTLGPDRFHEDTPDKQPTAKMTTPPVLRPSIRAGQNISRYTASNSI